MINSALEYCTQGWSVIPLKPRGKRPLVEWESYQGIAAGEDEIREWWDKWPDANIGVITGSVSGLVVIDLDGDGGAQLFEQYGLTMQRTGVVQTGKGYHGYYAYFDTDIGNRARWLSNSSCSVDVRGEGGYVVAPPSIHESGRVYQWVRPSAQIVALPQQLIA